MAQPKLLNFLNLLLFDVGFLTQFEIDVSFRTVVIQFVI